MTVDGNGDRQLHSAVATLDGKRVTCDSGRGCMTDHTVAAGSTPSPTPTPTAGGQTPGTPGPSTSAGASAPATSWASPDAQAPAAAAPPQAPGALASTGTTVGTAAAADN
ncbi:hypothetical protein [Streptomyces rubellomurinus]|uniref:hypothetical protein n=1 Tax=Streptomyces rubellomurinus (strain ATCC 31215) TaxID=359131 RepID=UPI00142897C9|nr:hypothetical protein [Streptomyces rubellomurinus]